MSNSIAFQGHLLPNDKGHWIKSSWISNELMPLLNSFRLSLEAAATTRAANGESIRNLSVGLGAVGIATILLIIGLIVCLRISSSARQRMNNAICTLMSENNLRPANTQPPFRI